MLSLLDRNSTVRDRAVEAWARQLEGGARILDVGAGSSRYKPLFAHCVYTSHDHPDVPYGEVDVRSDIGLIPLPSESFDAILCSEVLEHVPDPVAAIREISRLLRPSGRLLLTVPSACRVHAVPTHFWGGFAPDFFTQIVPAQGLAVRELRPLGNWSQYMAQEIGRLPEVIRDHTALPLRRVIAGFLWPGFRIAVPLGFLALSLVDRSTDLPLGWLCFAEKAVKESPTQQGSG